MNKAYEAYFDRPIDQILGRSLSEILDHPGYESWRPFVHKALAGETQTFEVQAVARADRARTTLVMNIPHRDAEGHVLGLYAVVQDVTKRHEAQKKLEDSERRFRQLADFNPAIVWLADAAGAFIYLNARWVDYTGLDEAQMLIAGRNDCVHPDDRFALDAAWASSLRERRAYAVEARLRRKDGVYRWHQMRAAPILDDAGSVSGWLGNDTDIDDLVREGQSLARSAKRWSARSACSRPASNSGRGTTTACGEFRRN